ncbi:MAG: hypothetical protein ACYTAO_02065, partial [Planctomycetota bacterium]
MTYERRAANEIVQAIIRDLRDRRGLKGEWDRMEPDISKQVRLAWERIVEKGMLHRLPGRYCANCGKLWKDHDNIVAQEDCRFLSEMNHIIGEGEVYLIGPPQFMGKLKPPEDLKVEDVDQPSKKLGWTCYEQRGWEVKVPSADFDKEIIKLDGDRAKLALIDSCENMTELRHGKKVLAMGITGWVRGQVITENGEYS